MSVTTPPSLPTHRERPFDPPEEYRLLQEEDPVSRLAFPDGKAGWLLTRHEDVRAMLSDQRFSSNRLRASSPVRSFPVRPGEPVFRAGSFIGMDAPEHTRYRRLLTRWFTTRRMRELTPRIERIVAEHLDAMERAGPPADLVPAFALPIPSLVICELLGVPYGDRAAFQSWTGGLLKVGGDEESVFAARDALWAYIRDLVGHKRREPDDALIGSLLHDPENPLTDDELAGVGLLLLVAGHETTANMLALGTLTLLTRPDQLRTLRERPELIDRAVEELLRYLSIVQFGLVRVAREDVVIVGRLIHEGETVVAALPAANRDPGQYADPDRLDITRRPAQHVAFGHGFHQCLGQQLARAEMKVAYPALFSRLPMLRLAVRPEEVPLRHDMFIYGVYRLPLTW
jgi:cytochrome P450